MPTLVRSWNLFHGRALGPDGRIAATGLIQELVEWAAHVGDPAVVCLQEVPPAALPQLADWSGMDVYAAIAQPPGLGPLLLPTRAAQWLTDLAPRVLRGAFSGQANAILVRRDLTVVGHEQLPLNPPEVVAAGAALLGLDPLARLAWEKEARVAQTLRVRLSDGRALRLVHLHATSFPSDPAVPDAEIARAAAWLHELAAPGDIEVLAGDLNAPPTAAPALARLHAEGFSRPAPWIDQVVVRGAAVTGPPVTWPEEARTRDGLILSDHSPVEVTIA